MGFEAKIILDSITERGHRLTTIQATFPRFILAEVNTHRMFSRNSASSRAIPVKTRIEQLDRDPFVPIAFGKNKAGMQSEEELLDQGTAKGLWNNAIDDAVKWAKGLMQAGVHKQWANRVIETYAWHTAVISATEWSNHDGLRCHPDASPEYQTIAKMMREARAASTPTRAVDGYWHLPYVYGPGGQPVDPRDIEAALALEKKTGVKWIDILRKVSVGRCAAVSYERQEVKDFEKDIDRYEKLKSSGHMSPFEHAARPMTEEEYDLFRQPVLTWHERGHWVHTDAYTHFCGNFQGWIQDRKMIPNEHDFSKMVKE